MEKNASIYVAGHRGMVGSAICRALEKKGFKNLVTRTSAELDLRNQQEVNNFFATERPQYVFLAAAKVGGITANNTYRAEFLYDNLLIAANVIHAAREANVLKLLFLGSSCIYPRMALQPLTEDALLTGALEPTNEPYAIAKIAGIKLCDAYRAQYGCNFISAMPTNLYGPHDNYHTENAHVLPSLIKKFYNAKKDGLPEVVVWGSGKPLREFMHADDLADACIFLMEKYNDGGFVNVGTGMEVSISELSAMVKEVVGYTGKITYDTTKPDGTPRKLMNAGKLHALGWHHSISLHDGLRHAFECFKREHADA